LRFKAVIFDLVNTLARWENTLDANKVCEFLQEQGYEVYNQEFDAAFRFVIFVYFSKHGLKGYKDMLTRICSFLELKVNEKVLEELTELYLRFDRMELYPDAVSTLKELKRRGIKTAIATTTPQFFFENVMLQLKGYIDIVVDGWEARAAKPSPKVYQKTLEKLGVRAKETVLVGDNQDVDIRPAKKLGITTVLIDRKGKIASHIADFKIKSLDELTKNLTLTRFAK